MFSSFTRVSLGRKINVNFFLSTTKRLVPSITTQQIQHSQQIQQIQQIGNGKIITTKFTRFISTLPSKDFLFRSVESSNATTTTFLNYYHLLLCRPKLSFSIFNNVLLPNNGAFSKSVRSKKTFRYKMKTHSGGGKLKRWRVGKSHLNTGVSRTRLRRLKKPAFATKESVILRLNSESILRLGDLGRTYDSNKNDNRTYFYKNYTYGSYKTQYQSILDGNIWFMVFEAFITALSLSAVNYKFILSTTQIIQTQNWTNRINGQILIDASSDQEPFSKVIIIWEVTQLLFLVVCAGASVFLGHKLYKQFGWNIYKKIGASIQTQNASHNTRSIIIQSIMVVLVIPMVCLALWGVRTENKVAMIIYVLASMVTIINFIYILAEFIIKRDENLLTLLAKAQLMKVLKPMTKKAQKDETVVKSIVEPVIIKTTTTTNKSNKKASSQKSVEEIYQKKSQLEHILLRPDTYIGSTESITEKMWTYDSDSDTMQFGEVDIVPGLYKIVDEILVNAADNKIRDPSMDTLKVTINKEQNLISIYNNGKGIPVKIHKEEGIYVPELIFGHLLTSSNYDDNEKKVTGGRNGYGAKLTNIFSKKFIVETADKKLKKKYQQVFRNNMSITEEPKIQEHTKNEEYTKITFKPDLDKFNLTELTDDTIDLLKKRVHDLAGCVKGIKVYLNNERIELKNFKDYVMKYVKSNSSDPDTLPFVQHEIVNDRWEVAVAASPDGQFHQVSGGTHVNHVLEQLVGKITETVKKKKELKDAKFKPNIVKNHLWVFINCLIENPAFDSQTKETLTLRQNEFGSNCQFNASFINKVIYKQESEFKKSDGSKKSKSKVSAIEKLSDAKNAGTKNSSQCTLILTEGDSAKTLAVAGLSAVGRDNYGVFPLKGKLLNVRDASTAQILKNEEIQNIKKILGLQHDKVYTSLDELRYGHLMIMTDQDHDGSHIKGLIINFLDRFYPSLMKIPGFLKEFITPICTNIKTKNKISFFTLPEYENWKKTHSDGKGWDIKYYKGLGTSSPAEAKEYFAALGQHMKPFKTVQNEERNFIDLAFSKKKVEERKDWLKNYKPGTYIDHNVSEISIDNFINRELILFSMADNVRSIPSVLDGLKPGQRKVLFSCFKRDLKKEIKVIQLAGYVSEHTAYHHGEASLHSTIITMANNFIGSNNINLLEPSGQFGSRIQGGKDSASARYINTRLNTLTRLIYSPHDDELLKYLNDDGASIEPEWYLPILPMVLVNGADGIGTGWSTSIPNFNPRDIVANLKNLMDGKELEPMSPWYRGFQGEIERVNGDKYKVSGIIERDNEKDNIIHITELPIKVWTQNYENDLKKLMSDDNKTTTRIKARLYTLWRPNFEVILDDELVDEPHEDLEKRFKTTSYLNTSNMVCFDKDGRLKKYGSPEEILEEFYHVRLEYYFKRKEHLLKKIELECKKLQNKNRFIKMKISRDLQFEGLKRIEIINLLESEGFDRIRGKDEISANSTNENENTSGYDYLMRTTAWNFSEEEAQKLDRLFNEKSKELSILRDKRPTELWIEDLDKFLEGWNVAETEFKKIVSGASKEGDSKRSESKAKAKSKSVKR
ncbi:3052_t:CDS:10 [Diversispora eburnea]|uniref:DNA topoisomerase 2 n=1 Tax=Diversispora eburnea TaxID=1213867 RepID=A0A9N8V6W6_9GLOM|nr:3052_t:CDS:10 [Diversispora eburnea]